MTRSSMVYQSGSRICVIATALLAVAFSIASVAADEVSDSTKSRLLWPDGHVPKLTTSRVLGSPEPPLPYTSRRMYPKLTMGNPVAVTRQPGSDRILLITLEEGAKGFSTIRRFVDHPDVDDTEVLLPADDRIAYDIVFHPQFQQNGYLFVGHNRPHALGKEKYTVISRFKMNPQPPYQFDPSSETTIIEWPSDGHNGAAMAFGLDGMFYVTTGDGTSDSDTNLRGQEMSHLTAKALRIDIEHPDPGKMYSVPADNPFVGKTGIAPETWAFGLRNPWRMTADRETGHIWIGNNGQDLWEQVYFLRKGENYGWSVYEGSHPFYLHREMGPAPLAQPTFEHHHSEARSLTGGIVYYGSHLPELRGAYIYGDHSTGKIWAAKHDGTKVLWHKELSDTPFHISGFGTDSHDELLICDYIGEGAGALYTLTPTPPQKDAPPFPRTLSASGLFRSVKDHQVEAALVPYEVNAPLWSDGAEKVRFMAIPGDSPKVEITGNRGWKFPDETVLVKSFSLEFKEGDATSKRWIETRFMTKQQNEWIGYSYRWNDEQTDATLVKQEGLDVDFTIQTKDGPRQQSWHYPSRTECMVCHSRAAGFVLGLSTGQMNRGHHVSMTATLAPQTPTDLGDCQPKSPPVKQLQPENQLTMLERFGWLKLDKKPAELEHLVNPYDSTANLTLRAKSYLHANCAICHVDAGGGNAQIQLEFSTPLESMRMVDAIPVHDKFGLADARVVAPGHPDRSVLLYRVARRGRGQMPQLATSLIDQPAIDLLTEWIKQLPAANKTGTDP